MRITVQRLRRWLLVGTGLLVLVIAAFLGYARYEKARFLKGISGAVAKMGINVKQQGGVFTFTKSVGSNTTMTIQGSKEVTLKDGKMVLYDVSILFYDRKQGRTDQMRAGEAEYDPSTGVGRADGEVQLDLQQPSAEGQAKMAPGSKDDRVVHAKMQGVVFLKNMGVAATEKDVDFQVRGMTGHAVGAEYNVDSGVLVLQSTVRMVGVNKGKPAELTAARAEYNHLEQKATLTQVKYVSAGKGGPMSAEAKDALVTLRHDGSVQQVDASGDVTLGSSGRTLRAAKMQALMNEKSEPKSVHGFGGLHFVDDEPLRKGDGLAAEGRLLFDAAGRPQHLTTTGAVRVTERQRGSQAEPWTTRTINAETADVDFVSVAGCSQVEMREARGNGAARLTMESMKAASPHSPGGMAETTMAADRFDVQFIGSADGLSHLHGEGGRTELRRTGPGGALETSSGDVMDAAFHPQAQCGATGKKTAAGPRQSAVDDIVSAVQQGHVVVTELPAKKPGDTKPQELGRGTATRAEYDGAQQQMTLVGGAVLVDEGSNVKADRIVMDEVTNDAKAEGSVKATLVQSDAAAAKNGSDVQVVHVTADHALVHRATQIAEFYGSLTQKARLWQEGSQVEAPVLVFERAQKVLMARGDGQQAAPVHSVFANVSSGAAGPSKGKTNVVRVASRELRYSDAEREGVFTGGVEVQSADGTMTAQRAEVFLQPKTATNGANAAPAPGMLGGNVERVTAMGGVKMVQLGRRGTGETLVYTPSDGKSVLTGTASAPPKIVDDQGRSETGASLIFHRGDDSVLISGEPASAGSSGQRVRTVTRAKQRRTQ